MVTDEGQVVIRKILLATDFSARSKTAEAFGLSLAAQYDAKVVFVHAIEPILGTDNDVDTEDEFGEFYKRLTDRAYKKLESRQTRAVHEDIACLHHVAIGHRWQVILECADTEDVDLIVMGRRAYREYSQVQLGTTSQRVYFGSRRPVMVIPQDFTPET